MAWWANENHTGVLVERPGGVLAYLDSGDEYDSVVAAGPQPPRSWSDHAYAPDPRPAPPLAPVTRLQAKAALLQAGKLAQVEAVVAASDALTQLAWAEAAEFRRDSPTIAALASGILTEAELDDLFAAAALISF